MSSSKPSEEVWQVVGRGKKGNRASLQTATSGRVPPNTSALPKPAPKKKKEDIPYEIKNAREWDPKRQKEADLSSESSDDDYADYYDFDDGEHAQVPGDFSSSLTDDGFQTVVNKRSQSSGRPYGQPQNRPKSYTHGKPSAQRRTRPRVNLNYKRDNLARAAFRKRLNPTGSFILPKDFFDNNLNQKNMYELFDEIGVRLGSFIRPPQHVEDYNLLLWGDARQIQTTKAELQRWVDSRLRVDIPRKPMAKDKFAREMSSIGNQYHLSMKKTEKEAKISEFQQVPAKDRIFPYVGTFLWPVDEVLPEDILGSSLEAFDPIRFQHRCHIVFDSKLSSFRIFSDKEESVKKTMNRIEGTIREYVAKSARPDILLLVEPPSSSAVRKDVKVLPAFLGYSKADKSVIPVLTGSALDPEALNAWLTECNGLRIKNTRRIELSLRKCIALLPHYRGLVRVRVQFGTFALKVYRWKEGADSTPLPQFIDNVNMPGTKGVMIRE